MKLSFPLKVHLLEHVTCTILFISYTHHSRMEDFDPSGVIGRPMTTGAHSGGDDRGRASTSFCWRRRRRRSWRTFDPQGSYTERGRPMTTGAQEVTTVDELQLRFLGGGGGVVGGPLTLRGRTLRGDAR